MVERVGWWRGWMWRREREVERGGCVGSGSTLYITHRRGSRAQNMSDQRVGAGAGDRGAVAGL